MKKNYKILVIIAILAIIVGVICSVSSVDLSKAGAADSDTKKPDVNSEPEETKDPNETIEPSETVDPLICVHSKSIYYTSKGTARQQKAGDFKAANR